MMKKFENREFVQWFDRDSGAVYSGLEFVKCRFESCGLSITRDPALRSIVSNVRLTKCEQRGSTVRAAILEDVVVDGLKTNGLFQIWGAVFKHMTLKNKIGRIMFSPLVAPSSATEHEQRAFDAANSAYYLKVDWALDISEAEFEGECDLRGVPSHLVRRDPETQVVVTRERAILGDWRKLDLSNTYWDTGIDFLLKSGDADVVLVAGKRDRRFSDLLDGLKKLRDAGVAEPE